MVGRPILRAEEAVDDTIQLKEIMVGEEASAARHSLDVKYPVENGIVRNWEDMEHLWNHTFREKLKINPADHKILLTVIWRPPSVFSCSPSRKGMGGAKGRRPAPAATQQFSIYRC